MSFNPSHPIELPQIIEEPTNVTVNIGDSVAFKCRASGDPQPEIVWMQNSNKIPVNNPRYEMLSDGTLKIANANADLVGEYECMAQNVVGEAKSRPVRMAINSRTNSVQINDDNRPRKPQIILKPFDLTVTSLENIVLHCVASG